MLCYHSSRKISDATRDALSWLVVNHRTMKVLLWPIMIMSVAATLAMYSHFEQIANADDIAFLAPFTLVVACKTSNIGIFLYVAMAVVSTLLIVPLLHRYFVDRRGLQHIKPKALVKIMLHNAKWASLAVIATGIGFYFMAKTPNILTIIFIAFAMTWLLPLTYMPADGRKWAGQNVFAILAGWIFMFMMYYVIIKLPYLIAGLLFLGMHLLDTILPGLFGDDVVFNVLFCAIINCLSCIAYCIGVIVLNVNALTLHGTIYTTE